MLDIIQWEEQINLDELMMEMLASRIYCEYHTETVFELLEWRLSS